MTSTSALSAWENFYIIVGSSGGALIGLQFVVITLIIDRRHKTTTAALSAFGTPTVVHLTAALSISAFMSVPWPSVVALSATLGLFGFGGLVYGAVVVRRTFLQTVYEPVWEDWVWYAALPSAGYAGLAIGAAILSSDSQVARFVIAGATLGLLLIGIHNAWDTVTHLAIPSEDQT